MHRYPSLHDGAAHRHRMATGMDIALWVAQGILAAVFVMAGSMKAIAYPTAKETMAWVSALPKSRVQLIGVMEMLGAIGVIVPRATGILPWLTPLAAAGLALVMLLALVFHVRRQEYKEAVGNVFLMALAIGVAVGTFLAL